MGATFFPGAQAELLCSVSDGELMIRALMQLRENIFDSVQIMQSFRVFDWRHNTCASSNILINLPPLTSF